mmetsp:Transcript_24555/g.79302  ORF Transcript_24555/g.79302 Transcript_24555/m.79302 type:complete len:244 (+) Transcript_24555:675-1406(+)
MPLAVIPTPPPSTSCSQASSRRDRSPAPQYRRRHHRRPPLPSKPTSPPSDQTSPPLAPHLATTRRRLNRPASAPNPASRRMPCTDLALRMGTSRPLRSMRAPRQRRALTRRSTASTGRRPISALPPACPPSTATRMAPPTTSTVSRRTAITTRATPKQRPVCTRMRRTRLPAPSARPRCRPTRARPLRPVPWPAQSTILPAWHRGTYEVPPRVHPSGRPSGRTRLGMGASAPRPSRITRRGTP